LSRTTRKRLVSVGMLLVVAVVWAVYLFPMLWLLMMSVKTQVDIFSKVPLFIFTPTLAAYQEQLGDERFLHALRNSLVVTLVAALFSMVLGSLAAYSLARFKLRLTTWLAVGLLFARMIPPIVFVVPLFLLYNAAGLRNSLIGLALIYTAFNVPFVVWLMRSFFEEVPVELEEAVLIDGGSRARAFWHVTMPLAAPGLAATAVFCVIAAWGEFLFALILTGPDTTTLPIYLASFLTDRTVEWGGVMSTGVLVILPLVLFGMMVQRHLIKGLTLGAMKG
jgi:ABC-type glycerol-3-phosphate transport system permease component